MRYLVLLLLPCLLACDDTSDPGPKADTNNGSNNGADCPIVGTAFINGAEQDACRCADGRLGLCEEEGCVCEGAHRGDPDYAVGCGVVETERVLFNAGEGCDFPSGLGNMCEAGEVRVDALRQACRPACQTDADCDRLEYGALLACLDPYQSGQTHCHQIVCEDDADCPARAPLCRLRIDNPGLDPDRIKVCVTAAAGLQ